MIYQRKFTIYYIEILRTCDFASYANCTYVFEIWTPSENTVMTLNDFLRATWSSFSEDMYNQRFPTSTSYKYTMFKKILHVDRKKTLSYECEFKGYDNWYVKIDGEIESIGFFVVIICVRLIDACTNCRW